jgi:hypothetical protein
MRDLATGNYLRDVFCEPHDGDTWICRRDETIRLTYRDIIHRIHDGIPYLAPELVLLFMAKHGCQKDQPDFDATVPHMTPGQSAVRRPMTFGLRAARHRFVPYFPLAVGALGEIEPLTRPAQRLGVSTSAVALAWLFRRNAEQDVDPDGRRFWGVADADPSDQRWPEQVAA